MDTQTYRVTVDTGPFVRSHGREPRGTGQWAFYFGDNTEPEFAPASQSYTAARRWAGREARRRGVRSVTVAS